MTAHMSGAERSQWIGLYEMESEERKSAIDKAKGQQPTRPSRSRTFRHRGRRR